MAPRSAFSAYDPSWLTDARAEMAGMAVRHRREADAAQDGGQGGEPAPGDAGEDAKATPVGECGRNIWKDFIQI